MNPTVLEDNETKLPQQVDKVIKTVMESTIGDYNDAKCRQYITDMVSTTLNYFMPKEMSVICDESNNTPDVIDGHNIVVDIVPHDWKEDVVRYKLRG